MPEHKSIEPEHKSIEFANVKQVSERYGVSASFLNKLRVTGGGPAYVKLGAAVRYKMSDVEAWLQSRTRHSTSEQAAA